MNILLHFFHMHLRYDQPFNYL